MDISSYLKTLKDLVSESRLKHVQSVSKMAERLATQWHEDVDKAVLAGLLHDAAKSLTPNTLLDFGVSETEVERILFRDYPKIWHAFVAPVFLQRFFEIEDMAVLMACKWHTTGTANMSLLEKIIFVSDFTELGRDISNREHYEELSFKNLDLCVFAVTKRSLLSLIDRHVKIHPETVNCYNYYSSILGDSNMKDLLN